MSDGTAQDLLKLFDITGKESSQLINLPHIISGIDHAVKSSINAGLTKEEVLSKLPEMVNIIWDDKHE